MSLPTAPADLSSLVRDPRRWVLGSALVIAAVGAVVYRPALDIGFWTDDFSFIDTAGRLPLPDYLRFYFDPLLQSQWYRPVQGLAWWVGYTLFRGEPMGYHLVQVTIHLVNCLLLFGLVVRTTGKWRLGLLSALVYVTLPLYALAVYWPGVADPLSSLFYLLTLWFWLDYVQEGKQKGFWLALAFFLVALLSKEVNVTLPLVLLLADLWLVRRRAELRVRVQEYAAFFVAVPVYALLELHALTRGVFTGQLGYGLQLDIVSALIQHSSRLAFPWGLNPPISYVWLVIVTGILAYAVYTGRLGILFLGAAAVLALLPVLPFPLVMAQAPRYLYLPLMASAVAVGIACELAANVIGRLRPWVLVPGSALLVLLLLGDSAAIAEGAVNFGGVTRETRMQFRPIFQRHAAFGPDTLLYFFAPPFPTPNISGVLFLRYGANVVAYGTDRDHAAGLREHKAAYIVYKAEDDTWQELPVDADMTATAAPATPVRFGAISLDGFDLASAEVKRGQAFGLILYWRGLDKIEKDYTVFAHLVDSGGHTVAAFDSQPHRGEAPTSRWRTGALLADGMIVPVDASVAPGAYTIQVGLYDLANMQRLAILNASGQPITDKIVIGPVQVEE